MFSQRIFQSSLYFLLMISLTSCYLKEGSERRPPRPEYKVIDLQQIKKKQEDRRELKALKRVSPFLDTLRPGDILDLSVYNEPDLENKNILVRPDGFISVKLIGEVQVKGLSIQQATSAIVRKFKFYIKSPKVTLSPVKLKGRKYTVLGAINRPGNYELNESTHLLDAIGATGGFPITTINQSQRVLADLKHAVIIRNQRPLPIDFEALLQGKGIYNIPVMPGDYIYIPSIQQETVYVLGEVIEQSGIPYQRGFTLTQLFAASKGFKDLANLNQIQLVRGRLNSPELYLIDFRAILQGTEPDIYLKPNDIIYVPPGPAKQWNQVLGTVLPTLQAIQSGFLFYEVLRNPK